MSNMKQRWLAYQEKLGMTNDTPTPAADGLPEMRRGLAEKFSLLASGSRDNWDAWLGDADAFLASLATPTPADVADDEGPIADAARRIASWTEGKPRISVYKAAKAELASLVAEVERLKGVLADAIALTGEAERRMKAAEAKAERMKAALEAVELARHSNDEAHWLRATKLTDAALNPTQEEGGR